jgi:hypothetical protein
MSKRNALDQFVARQRTTVAHAMKFVLSAVFGLACFLVSFSLSANGATDESLSPEHDEKMSFEYLTKLKMGWGPDGIHKEHCRATEEYIKAVEFLRRGKTIPENDVRKIADWVSAGCTGSANRFVRTYQTLQKSGVSLQKSVEVALLMTKEDDVAVENFHEIFGRVFASEFFDSNFHAALQAAMELSRNFKGDLSSAKTDFNQFTKFCLDQKTMGLAVQQCGVVAVRFTKFGQYFIGGVFTPFKEIYELLRDDKRFGISIQESLDVAEKVLRNGPASKLNFIQAFNYAISNEGLNVPNRDALEFALRMTERSYSGEHLPLNPGFQMFRLASPTAKYDLGDVVDSTSEE